jgi:predicted transposase/invertase (TIGR01784 family)
MYFLRHLAEFDEIPSVFTEPYLIQACEIARYAGLSPWERYAYEQSLKSARDSYAVYKTVEEESLERGLEQGLVRGREEERTTIALAMLNDNQPIDTIVKYTGLSEEEVVQLMQLVNSST